MFSQRLPCRQQTAVRSEHYVNAGTLTPVPVERTKEMEYGALRAAAALLVGGGWQLYLPPQPVVSSDLMSIGGHFGAEVTVHSRSQSGFFTDWFNR